MLDMLNQKIKILTLGHLPTYLGGRQSSGLAYVIWKIADSINEQNSKNEVLFVSTDIFKEHIKINSTHVFGWNKSMILITAILSPLDFISFVLYSIRLKIEYSFNFFNTLAKILLVNKLIRKNSDDLKIIHAHGVNNFIILNGLAKLYHLKIILTIHGITGHDKNLEGWQIQRKLEQKITKVKSLSTIIFITTAVKLLWNNLYGSPLAPGKVINNGIDTNVFFYNKRLTQAYPVTKIGLLTIGNISKLKGQQRVLEALIQLPDERRKNFRYAVIGRGTEKDIDALKTAALKANLDFEYLGYLEPAEMVKQIHQSDYMILPSSSEGFGMVYLESIACGTPVIIPKTLPLASERGILNPVNSIFIEDHSAEAIKTCLLSLHQSRFSRNEVSDTVSHLTWNKIAVQYMELFDNILAEK